MEPSGLHLSNNIMVILPMKLRCSVQEAHFGNRRNALETVIQNIPCKVVTGVENA
jgi:hypothetical protein